MYIYFKGLAETDMQLEVEDEIEDERYLVKLLISLVTVFRPPVIEGILCP